MSQSCQQYATTLVFVSQLQHVKESYDQLRNSPGTVSGKCIQFYKKDPNLFGGLKGKQP